jgi:chromosome segregation ATPase
MSSSSTLQVEPSKVDSVKNTSPKIEDVPLKVDSVKNNSPKIESATSKVDSNFPNIQAAPSIVDFVKRNYPKVIFKPFKLSYSKALGFIIADKKLIVGYLNKDGTLCKAAEPIDIEKVTKKDIDDVIDKIPVVSGFSAEDKKKLQALVSNSDDVITKTEHASIVQELKKNIQKDVEQQFKVMFDSKNDEAILIKNGYEKQLGEIKLQFEEQQKQLQICKTQVVSQKDTIVNTIKQYEDKMKTYARNNDIKAEDMKGMIEKMSKEKSELESKLQALIQSEKDAIKKLESNQLISTSRIAELEKLYQTVSDEKVNLEKSLKEVVNSTNELKRYKAEAEEIMKRLQKSEELGATKDRVVEDLKQDIQKIEKAYVAKMQEKENQVSDLQKQIVKSAENIGDVKRLQAELQKTTEEKESLKRQFESEKDNIKAQYQSTLDALNANIQALQKENEAIQKDLGIKLSELARERDGIKQQLSDLSSSNSSIVSDLENRLQELIKEREMIKQQMVDNSSTVSGLESRLQEITKERDAIKQKISNDNSTISNLESQLREIANERDAAKKQNSNDGSAISNLESQLREIMNERGAINQQLAERSAKVSDLESRLQEITKERDGIKEKMLNSNSTISNYESQLREIVKERDAIKQQLSGNNAMVTNLESRLRDISNERDVIKKQMMDLANERDAVKKQLSDVSSTNSSMMSEFQSKLRNLENERDAVKKQLSDVSSTNSSMISDLESKLRNIANERDTIKQQLGDMSSSNSSVISDLESQLKNLANERDTIKQQLGDMSSSNSSMISDLQAQLRNLANDRDAVKQQLGDVSSSNSSIISDLQLQLRNLANDKDAIKQQLADVSSSSSSMVADLQAQLRNLTENRDAVKQQLADVSNSSSSMVAELQFQLRNIINERDAIKQQLADVSSSNSSMISDLESQLRKIADERDAVKQQLSDVSSSNSSMISDLESQLRKIADERDAVKQQLSDVSSSNNTTISNLTRENDTLSSNFSNAKSEISRLKEAGVLSSEAYEKKVNEFTTKIKEGDDQIARITEALREKDKQLGDYNSATVQLKEANAQLQAQIEQIMIKQKEYISEIDNREKNNQTLQDKVLELQQLSKQLSDDKFVLERSVKDLIAKEKVLQATSEEFQGLKKEHDNVLRDREALQSTLDQMREQLRALERGRLEQDDTMKKHVEEIQNLQNELQMRKSDLAKLEETVSNITKELEETKKLLAESELKNSALQGYTERCVNKFLKEKDTITNAIKEYRTKWETWVESYTGDTMEYKRALIQELNQTRDNIYKFLNSVQLSNKEQTALRSAAKDVEIQLQATISELMVSLNVKDEKLALMQQKLKEQNEIDVRKDNILKALKAELEDVRRLLAENAKTKVDLSFDYESCYNLLQNFFALNNIFFRKQEIIKKLENVISNNIGYFSNLSPSSKQKVSQVFQNVQKNILDHINFLNLKRFIDNPNFNYLKNKVTRNKVPKEFCDDLVNILEYWNSNKAEYWEQDRILTNIYEDLSGAVRVYIRIKPLLGSEQKSKTVYMQVVDNKKQRTIRLDCTQSTESRYKLSDVFGEFYGIFDETYSNLDVFTGVENSLSTSNLTVDFDNIQESSESASPGLYSAFKQVEDGYSIVIFGYGASGSGKTFTLLGTNGMPGLIHYGFANMQGVRQIKLKYLFEQYYNAVNVNFAKLRGKIYNLIREVPQMRGFSLNMNDDFSKRVPSSIKLENLKVEDLYILTDIIEKYRIEKGRIKKTPNNPVSSRSHLYFVFEVTFDTGKTGYVTFVDTAGRESPIDIFQTFIDKNKTKLASVMSPAGGEDLINDTMIVSDKEYTPKHIFEVLNEGFYINETINHLVYFFNKKNYKDSKVLIQSDDIERYDPTRYYVKPQDEENTISESNNCLTIPILKFLDSLSNKGKGDEDIRPTKFISILAVRQEAKYCDQTYETLQFAQSVKSS